MNFSIALRSELLKTKRTASFYLTLVGAAVVPVVFLLNMLTDGLEATREDPLNGIFKLEAEANGFAIFPWFIILVSTLLPQLEYRNNTWKQVLASPVPKHSLVLAKFLNIHLLMLLFLVSSHLFMFGAIALANLTDEKLKLFSYTLNGKKVLINAANTYIAMLALVTIQFWLGLRFRNFIVPIAIGLSLWLTGIMLAFQFNSPLIKYFPYSFQIFPFSPKHASQLEGVQWTSAGYAVAILALALLDFRRREIHK
jgi:hypothetical protein